MYQEVNVSEVPSMYQEVNVSEVPSMYQEVNVSEVPSMYQEVNYLRYLPCIKKFGLPPSASCPVNRNITSEECFHLESFQRDVHLFLKFRLTSR